MKTNLALIQICCLLAISTTGVVKAQTVIYSDSFSRGTSEAPISLGGTIPDVADTSGNAWIGNDGSNGGNSGSFSTDGTEAFANNVWMPNAYLPVNGTSGITLDGSESFTLSGTFSNFSNSPASDGDIFLTSNPSQYDAQFGSGIVAASSLNGQYNQDVLFGPGYSQITGVSAPTVSGGASNTISLAYDSTTQLLSFELNGSPTGETLALTSGQISSITGIGMGFDGNWNGSTSIGDVSSFTFTETLAAPEPSTYMMVFGGLGLLMFLRKRSRLC